MSKNTQARLEVLLGIKLTKTEGNILADAEKIGYKHPEPDKRTRCYDIWDIALYSNMLL